MSFGNVKTERGQQSLIPDEAPASEDGKSFNGTIEEWIDDLVFALQAPLIVWKGFEKETPSDWKDKATKARLLHLMSREKGEERGLATDLELCFYISQFTLEHPPSHEVGEVYMYAFRKAFGEKVSDAAGLPKVLELESTSRDLYWRARRWIYKQQLEHVKTQAGRQSRNSGKETARVGKNGEEAQAQSTLL